MKYLLNFFGLVILASVAFAQGDPLIITEFTISPSHDGSTLQLQWRPLDIKPDSAAVTYNIIRRSTYHDLRNQVHVNDSLKISSGLKDHQYNDVSNLNPCYHYTYWVWATVVGLKGVVKDGPSRVAEATQIKGGVNAVVIYPTSPNVTAVADRPDTIVQIQACQPEPNSPLRYSLTKGKEAGLLIDPNNGVIYTNMFKPGNVTSLEVAGIVDNGVKPAEFSFTINVTHLVPAEAEVTGTLNFGAGSAFPVTLTLHKIGSVTPFDTISDGTHFTFIHVTPGTYRLSYSADSLPHGVLWYNGNFRNADSATVIVVTENDRHIELDPIILVRTEPRKGVVLSGKVHRLNDGGTDILIQAIEVSDFFRRKINTHPGTPRVSTRSAVFAKADGSYSLQLDTGSTYVLLASAAGYQSHFVGADINCSSPYCAPLYSPRNDTAVSDSYIGPSDTSGQQISGNVSSLTNSSIGVRAMILLSSTKQGTITSGYSGGLVPFETVTSDDAGNFVINSVARDTTGETKYLIQAVPFQDYSPSYYAVNDSALNTMLWEHANLFAVDTVKKDPLLVSIHVSPMASGTGTIIGHVIEVSQEVETSSINAYVYAVDQASMMVVGYALTDGSGNYVISNLPAGTYSIFADKISYHYGMTSDVSILSTDTGSSNMPPLRLTRDVVGINSIASVISSNVISAAYPNPVADAAIFHVDAVSGATLKIFDMLGRECADLSAQLRFGSGFVTFHADHFVTGSYLVKLQDQRGISSRPIMVVR